MEMDIREATTAYEAWLGKRLTLVPGDLEAKHRQMTESPFAFLRATFYRWSQLWPDDGAKLFPNLVDAPRLLAVGDTHAENFGTWRDAEGRLVWGLNDFDEATEFPYTLDLVRLATSVLLAIETVALPGESACRQIGSGYSETLQQWHHARIGEGKGGTPPVPIVLAEANGWLRDIARYELRDPEAFWRKLDALPDAGKHNVPPEVQEAVRATLPGPLADASLHWKLRQAGLGSLGRQRLLALCEWQGGRIAREAKALAPSAWLWAHEQGDSDVIRYRDILEQAIRCPDPWVQVRGRWVVRRLAPDCIKVRLLTLPKPHEANLLYAMGREIANIHIGCGGEARVNEVRHHLKSLPDDWLHGAARAMADRILEEWNQWKSAQV